MARRSPTGRHLLRFCLHLPEHPGRAPGPLRHHRIHRHDLLRPHQRRPLFRTAPGTTSRTTIRAPDQEGIPPARRRQQSPPTTCCPWTSPRRSSRPWRRWRPPTPQQALRRRSRRGRRW
jgi:hypothetical protein